MGIITTIITIDFFVKVVTPAKAGVQGYPIFPKHLDSGLRRNDGNSAQLEFCRRPMEPTYFSKERNPAMAWCSSDSRVAFTVTSQNSSGLASICLRRLAPSQWESSGRL